MAARCATCAILVVGVLAQPLVARTDAAPPHLLWTTHLEQRYAGTSWGAVPLPGGLLALCRADRPSSGLLRVVRAADGKVVWQRGARFLAADDARVYVQQYVHEADRIAALDGPTGTQLWDVALPPSSGGTTGEASLVSDGGRAVWSQTGPSGWPPAGPVHCVDARTGRPLWQRDEIATPYLVLADRLFAAVPDKGGYTLRELDLASGATRREVWFAGDDYTLCLERLSVVAGDPHLYADQLGVSVGRQLPSLAVLDPALATVFRVDMAGWCHAAGTLVCKGFTGGDNNLVANPRVELVGQDTSGRQGWHRGLPGLLPASGLVEWEGQAVTVLRERRRGRIHYRLVGLRPTDGKTLWSLGVRLPAPPDERAMPRLSVAGPLLLVAADEPGGLRARVDAYRR